MGNTFDPNNPYGDELDQDNMTNGRPVLPHEPSPTTSPGTIEHEGRGAANDNKAPGRY